MNRARAGRLVRLLVAVLLTGFVFWKSDPSAVLQAGRGAAVAPLLGAAALVLVDRALMAYRWLVLLRPFTTAEGPHLPAVMRIFFVSTFVGTFLPASVGGDAVRAYALARHDVAGPAALASVVMDRVLGVVSILVMAIVGLVLARELAWDPVVMTALALTTAGCVAAAAVVFSDRAEAIAQRLFARLPWQAVRRTADRLLAAMQAYAHRRGDLGNVLVGSLGVQVLRILQAYLLGVSMGLGQPLSVYFAFIPLILLVILLPVTVNGLGTSQAAFVWFFGHVGVASPVAFALSILFVALGVIGNLPGGVLYATGGLHGKATARGR